MSGLSVPGSRNRDDLRLQLDELRQEYEQILVKLETADDETARAVEQITRLEAEIAQLRRNKLRQHQIILELREALLRGQTDQAASAPSAARSTIESYVLREELQITAEELRVSHEELEGANGALQQANLRLEANVAERTAQLEKAVLQLSDAVKQRDGLLEAQSLLAREVDHRVKNSLQMVTSMLAMQAAAAEGESEQRALQQACSRVQAVAHTHALLYKTGGAESVPFQDYLEALCRDLQSSLAPEAAVPTILCRADPADIPADYALPLALVVNELVTNAMKHAFPGDRQGHVEVSFTRHEAQGWRLTVADDGVGLRSWPPAPSERSLGVRIVAALVDRLHGKLAVETGPGTRFTLDIDPQQSAA